MNGGGTDGLASRPLGNHRPPLAQEGGDPIWTTGEGEKEGNPSQIHQADEIVLFRVSSILVLRLLLHLNDEEDVRERGRESYFAPGLLHGEARHFFIIIELP